MYIEQFSLAILKHTIPYMQWTWILILVSVIVIAIGLILLWINGIESRWGVGITILGLLIALVGLTAIIFGFWQPSKVAYEDACGACAVYTTKKYEERLVSEQAAAAAIAEEQTACEKFSKSVVKQMTPVAYAAPKVDPAILATKRVSATVVPQCARAVVRPKSIAIPSASPLL